MPKHKLTDKFLLTARPVAGANRSEYFDANVVGLSVIISANTKTFYQHFSDPLTGKRQRLKIGRYGDVSLAVARDKARAGRTEVAEGKSPLVERRAAEAGMTVSDLVESFIVRHAASKRSADEIARRLRKNIVPAIGSIKLSNLHRRDLTRAIDAIVDRGAPVEADRVFADLRNCLRWAYRRGDIDSDMATGMVRPMEPTIRDRVLSAEELRQVWNALETDSMWPSCKRIVRICMITGQRVGEIAGMRHDELDLDHKAWVIPPARSKNGREHNVPLSSSAVDLLREQMPDSGSTFVFPGRYGDQSPIRVPALAKAIQRFQEAGEGARTMPHWTAHDLRRSAATHMEEIGISPFVIGHVLNHVSSTKASITSRVYARYTYDKEKREALELWADRLTGIIAGATVVSPLRRLIA